MFDSLSDRLQAALGGLTGRGRISEEDVNVAMREVRMALLEADVNLRVVRRFIERVREKAMGREVLESLTPGQHLVKILKDEGLQIARRTVAKYREELRISSSSARRESFR